jgi:hypothetical protein
MVRIKKLISGSLHQNLNNHLALVTHFPYGVLTTVEQALAQPPLVTAAIGNPPSPLRQGHLTFDPHPTPPSD